MAITAMLTIMACKVLKVTFQQNNHPILYETRIFWSLQPAINHFSTSFYCNIIPIQMNEKKILQIPESLH